MVIPTKVPAPDKPGPLAMGLDHEDWDPGRPYSAIKAVQAERHMESLRGSHMHKAEAQIHTLPPEQV